MTRSISYSETATLLDCQAKHDFSYVGQLAGSALGPLTKHARLREGKAWGRAMAAFHGGDTDGAHNAISASLIEDARELPFGLTTEDQIEFTEMGTKLHDLLAHYYAVSPSPISIDRQELELSVAIGSRGGQRASNHYRFTGFVDGIHTSPDGDWIVEFKLRGQLSSLEQIALSRQIRWYAWAWRETTGRDVVGVIVDERLNAVPKPARILASGKPSHAKDQATTPALYVAACSTAGVKPDPDTEASLASKRWQARHEIFLSTRELDEAGHQLTSLARLVGQFDSGHLYPVRNPSQFRCPSCAFKDICSDPSDSELVDALFARKPAKRDRQEIAA